MRIKKNSLQTRNIISNFYFKYTFKLSEFLDERIFFGLLKKKYSPIFFGLSISTIIIISHYSFTILKNPNTHLTTDQFNRVEVECTGGVVEIDKHRNRASLKNLKISIFNNNNRKIRIIGDGQAYHKNAHLNPLHIWPRLWDNKSQSYITGRVNGLYPFDDIIVMGAYEKHVGIHNQRDLNLHQKFMKNDIFIEYRLLGNKKGWSKNDKKCRIAIIEQ